MKCIRAAIAVCLPLLAVCGTGSLHAQNASRAWQYQSPLSGARMVPPGTNIIIRPGDRLDNSSVHDGLVAARGTTSGEHPGRILLADDGRTILFTPRSPFAPGESVTIELRSGVRSADGGAIPPKSFAFQVGPVVDARARTAAVARMLDAERGGAAPYGSAIADERSGSIPAIFTPSDSFPQMVVSVSSSPSPGNLFLSNISIAGGYANTPYLIRMDNSAVPLFSRRMTSQCSDFKMQPDGRYSYADWNAAAFYLLDSSYRVVDSVRCGNGYVTDIHELEMLPNGHALLLGLDLQTVDMSALVPGGDSMAQVTGMVIQELDTARNVVFEWRTLDHIPVTDATSLDLTSAAIDYIHCNAIDLDTDGNLLLSSRHLDEITKIDRSTGEIIWRLGGKHNQFTFVNDSLGFNRQHAIRRIANGNITLFDNGNTHEPQFSRGVEYQLDEQAMTATLVWEYRHSPDIYTFAMGNVQRLDNGNTLIDWGSPNGRVVITEVRPDGTKALEILMPDGICSYRAFRFPGPQSLTTSLLSPADSALEVPYKPVFIWNPYAGATGYHLQVATDTMFTSAAVDTVVDSTLCLTGKLSLDSLYYWRVMPVTSAAVEGWSDVWSFTTEAVAAAPELPAERTGIRLRAETSADGGTLLLRYALPAYGPARIALTDMRGEEVAVPFEGVAGSEESVASFDAHRLRPGVYLCRLTSPAGSAVRKLVVLH